MPQRGRPGKEIGHDPPVQVGKEPVFLGQRKKGPGADHVVFFFLKADQDFVVRRLAAGRIQWHDALAEEQKLVALDGGENACSGVVHPCRLLGDGRVELRLIFPRRLHSGRFRHGRAGGCGSIRSSRPGNFACVAQDGKKSARLAARAQNRQKLGIDANAGSIGHFVCSQVTHRFAGKRANHIRFDLRVDQPAQCLAQVMPVDPMRRKVKPATERAVVVAIDTLVVNVGNHGRLHLVRKLQRHFRAREQRLQLVRPLGCLDHAVLQHRKSGDAAGRGKFRAGCPCHHGNQAGKQDTGEERDPGKIEQGKVDRHHQHHCRGDHGDDRNEGLDCSQKIRRLHLRVPVTGRF